MSVAINRLFRYKGNFYKLNQKFKGKLSPTLVGGYRQYLEEWKRGWDAPKAPRASFRSDYLSLKDRWGLDNTIYLKSMESLYDGDANTGLLVSMYPMYYIEGGRIKGYEDFERGSYSSAMFIDLEPIDFFPREKDGLVIPGEDYKDTSGKYGFNAQCFIDLKGLDMDYDYCPPYCNMTGTGKPIQNGYNDGYEYKDGALSEVVIE